MTAAIRPPRRRTTAGRVGRVLGAAVLVVAVAVVTDWVVADVVADRRQDALRAQLEEQWQQGGPGAVPDEVAPGDPVAVLHVPRWGAHSERVVVEGTAEEQLAQGPGHYVGTAMPGRPGNVGIAGHRVGEGSPFLHLDTLRPGDPVVLETADAWFVYRVLGDLDPSGIPGRQIVAPEDVRVISPTPNGPPDAAPTGAYLTLTTCHPLFSARERLVVHAVLDGDAVPKSTAPGGPPALR